MDEAVILKIFFAWIGTASLFRMLAMSYISKTMHVYTGFHFWTLSSFFNFTAMFFFILGPTGDSIFHYVGYIVSFFSLLFLPYGLKKFGKVEDSSTFTIFTLCLLVLITILLIILPYSAKDNLSITTYSAIIPVFMFSIYYVNHRDTIHKDLRKRLVISTFTTGIILAVFRLALTVYDAEFPLPHYSFYNKQWVTILIDINSTCIYFGLIILNFRKTEFDLKESIKREDVLEGLIPICAECKKIRDDTGYWNQLESYISSRSGAKFSHGICPNCIKKLYPELSFDKDKDLE